MTWTRDVDDDVLNVLNILKDNWNATTVTKPEFHDITLLQQAVKYDLQRHDRVFIYEVSHTERPASLGQQRQHWEKRISIDIRTSNKPPRVQKLWKEAKRCLMANRNNPVDSSGDACPFNVIKPVSRNNLSDGQKGLWRIVYDVLLLKFGEVVAT